MLGEKTDIFEDGTEEVRRAVHDVAAAIISARALAETLAEHVPTLVAMSRAKHPARQAHIPPTTLDSLPAIPGEIIELCSYAQGALKVLGNTTGAAKGIAPGSTHGTAVAANNGPDAGYEQVDCTGIRVLLVEDEETARYVFSQTLVAHGCRVTGASDGEEALRLFDTMDFDLILMDLRLPGMSGCETTERLREIESAQGRHTHIVGLTASPLLDDQVRGKAAGMDEVLVKPIDERALRSVFNLEPVGLARS